MQQTKESKALGGHREFYLRTLTKAGSSRYLSVGTLLPKDWVAVKVYVLRVDKDGCNLHIEPIR